jgi:hypothetical protein
VWYKSCTIRKGLERTRTLVNTFFILLLSLFWLSKFLPANAKITQRPYRQIQCAILNGACRTLKLIAFMHSSLVSTVEVFIFPLTFLRTSPGLPEMTTTFKLVSASRYIWKYLKKNDYFEDFGMCSTPLLVTYISKASKL